MSILITILMVLFTYILSKFFFKKIFNPLSIYVFIWGGLIVLYELKLIPYDSLNLKTWFIVFLAFFLFLIGCVTVFFATYLNKRDEKTTYLNNQKILSQKDIQVLALLILIFSVVGIFSAFQHWYILINKFGSIASVLLNATKNYRMRVQGELDGVIPYLFISSYIAIFFSAIYTAYKKKITLLSILPVLAIIIKEIANMGRAGILLGVIEFFTVFIMVRYYLTSYNYKDKIRKRNIFYIVTFLLIIFVGSAVFVKFIRKPIDKFKGTSQSLEKYEGNAFFSPSIYLYMSVHLGVFNSYLEKDNENYYIGENTFLPIYNLISKFNVIEHPSFFQKGYFVPMWANTGTYLRELHTDFGIGGVVIIPYLLGLIVTWLWLNFFRTGSLTYLVLLTYSFLIIFFSFLVMVSRLSSWFISLIILIIITSFIEKFLLKYKNIEKKNIK